MHHQIPFQLENFEVHCSNLHRVGIDSGFVLYTNHHASNNKPVARLLTAADLVAAKTYLANPSDEAFMHLVARGVLLDTEWDRQTEHWQIISFEGWEVLHTAFNRLHVKSGQALQNLTGLSELDMVEV